MPLERCAICCDEKLPEFLQGPPDYRCCRDFEACNWRAYRRLVGGRKGVSYYREACPPPPVAAQLELDGGEQLGLDLGGEAA